MEFQALIVKIAKILESLEIPYAITGGYAVSIWGRLRATFDIDVVIELPISKASVIAKALKKISEMSYIDEDSVIEAVERQDEFQFLHIESGIKIDFWVLGDDEFSASKIKRRRTHIIEGEKIYFLSPEDLMLSKLLWCKETQSEQQIGDISSIIRMQKNLDFAYLRKWANVHSTKRLLEKLLKENS